MINPVFLRTFMSLLDTRHFTQTAQALNMTQPGVSQHIKKLEAQLGQVLLNRHGKTFELSRAGLKLQAYGVQQLQAEAELRRQLLVDDKYQGECRLACSGSMATLFYPRLLGLQQHHPRLNFAVEAAPNAVIIERLQQDASDIGLVTQPANDPSLEQVLLGEDELCLILPAVASSDWQALMTLGFINHPDGHHYAAQLLERNYGADYIGLEHVPESGYINQISQILLPVTLGLGFTVLPKSVLSSYGSTEQLQLAPLENTVTESVYLLYKKHRQLGLRYQVIIEFLEAHWA